MRMKKIYYYLLLFTSLCYGQIPANYYDTATGTGYTLKTQLYNIVSTGHVDQGYSALYLAYQTTHSDDYYENDGSVLDFYSENPAGTDSYFYTHGSNQCGSYNSENDCYNREHLMPQSVYSENYPMRSDVHQVIPSDGYVNNRRGSFAFGEVSSPTWTSNNGSKVGPNTFGSYSGTVFEPIDEFKGDIARALLYFAVRYETQVASWSHAMLNGTSDQVYEDWFVDLLLDWHANDPVVQAEIDRNNAAYNFQGNANPFVDHPEFVTMIWSSGGGGGGGTGCTTETFENIPASASSYTTRNWTGDDGGAWTATDARTDQTLNSRAITVRNGAITAPTVGGGIASLTVTTQRVFSGGSGTFNLKVNGGVVGTIAYDATQQTITVPNINISGSVSIVIDGNSGASNRVKFDDLSWTCYDTLGSENFELDEIKIIPNPAKQNMVRVTTKSNLNVEFYDVLGKKVLFKTITPTNNTIDVTNFNKGVYLVRLSNELNSVTKKLIIQ